MKRHLLITSTLIFRFATALALAGCGQSEAPKLLAKNDPAPAPAVAPAAAPSQPAGSGVVYSARSGSKMRIEGTSNIHDWQVESPFIGGMMEVGPGFPIEPGQAATPGKMDAKADVFIQVRSLKSIEKDGRPYSDMMDKITWEHLKEEQYKRITYHLTELTLKETPKTKDAPYVFDAKGDLAVAGVTNNIAMVVNILPQADKKLEITGTISFKMTQFKVEPPAPKIALGLIKTGDEVKLIFKWIVGQRKAAAPANP
ncbi:MAG: YceI family protein [Bryobacteraceae bacterium]